MKRKRTGIYIIPFFQDTKSSSPRYNLFSQQPSHRTVIIIIIIISILHAYHLQLRLLANTSVLKQSSPLSIKRPAAATSRA